jgi:transcriptional regulator with XRE-family HTH domain
LRAARALVGMNQERLAEKTGLSVQTIKRMESIGLNRSAMENVQAVINALQAEGVIFIPENGEGVGVRLAKRNE